MTDMIYLDNNATTPVHPAVLEAMLPLWRAGGHGNPSSAHGVGRAARKALAEARETAARALGARPDEIAFAPNGTCADNVALLGTFALRGWRGHLVTAAIEHPAVLRVAEELERRGVAVTRVGVDASGVVDVAAVRAALRPDTALVSLMLANNEVGTLQPVRAVVELARARGVLVHSDVVQAFGKVRVDAEDLGVDILALSAHKFHGPKGVGLLYARSGRKLGPQAWGAGQEHGLFPGTENVAYAVGMAEAMRRASAEVAAYGVHTRALRDRLWDGLAARVSGIHRNGDPARMLPNTLNFSCDGVEGDQLMMNLDLEGVAVSTGSACHSGAIEPSHVLTAMGCSPERGRGALRVSLAGETRPEEIERVLALLPAVVERLRALGGGGAGGQADLLREVHQKR
ncbi:MAG: cysteine desulfurase [Planctomycetes bacterium]|nr:cysteine desulfurase [Planctomycetota bacterium]